jgi:hypothetical protein
LKIQGMTLKERLAQKHRAKKWNKKVAAAHSTGARYYGDGGTVHNTNHLDVMVDENGAVKAVWFRCQLLPFEQHKAREWDGEATELPKLTGVEVEDLG